MALPQFSFSGAGAQDWQDALHALPPAEQQQEADAASNDFASWLPQRFSLSSEQVAFLGGVDAALVEHWGQQVGFFIEQGWPISLDKPDDPVGVRGWKRVTSEEKTTSQQTQQQQRNGGDYSLVFTISY